ncbi:hypothetical protein BKA66DRAFT_576416 [Pyrenochaeta sp. MPI-SDFR-AT-0127]|nr:hypothetical protein BKA66DRAFT_576416 [Pyrenochaeta sp. MPI-SDFR-AT-0127]
MFMLRKFWLPKKEKIGLILVMMVGGFVLVVSIIRLKITVNMAPNPDITWEYVRNGIWWFDDRDAYGYCLRMSSSWEGLPS